MKRVSLHVLVLLCFCLQSAGGSELIYPVATPHSRLEYVFAAELDDDLYSGDLVLSGEYAPCDCFSVYLDGSYRLLSYSYEYSSKGYVHNYAKLHVNGLNETYLGVKMMAFRNFGVNAGWRFPPREGSQKERFHRLNVEPFVVLDLSRNLELGASFRYDTFLERKLYKPGDELGLRASIVWKPLMEPGEVSGWTFSETVLFQTRIQESENRGLDKPYRQMDDIYQGFKMKFTAMRFLDFLKVPFGVGLNYELQRGTLFGFETGHRIGIVLRAN